MCEEEAKAGSFIATLKASELCSIKSQKANSTETNSPVPKIREEPSIKRNKSTRFLNYTRIPLKRDFEESLYWNKIYKADTRKKSAELRPQRLRI